MAKLKWTPKLVAARLEEAANTMKRLPSIKIQGYSSSWPPFIQEFWEAYGWSTIKVRLGPPLPDAITRMDESLEWLCLLEASESKLVWARATGIRWKSIALRLNVTRQTLRQRWMASLTLITNRLNRL